MPALAVVIYSKTRCSLCDEAVAAVERVRARLPFDLKVVDITTLPHAELLRYRYEIPVVFVGGRELFRHRVDEGAFEAAVRAGTSVADAPPKSKAK